MIFSSYSQSTIISKNTSTLRFGQCDFAFLKKKLIKRKILEIVIGIYLDTGSVLAAFPKENQFLGYLELKNQG